MKKILLVVWASAVAMISQAQVNGGKTFIKGDEVKVDLRSNATNKTDVIDWYNYGDEQRQLGGRLFSWTPIFPDSSVLFEYTTGYSNVNWHAMGQVFDPKGPLWFSKSTKLDSNDTYTVDSLEIPFRYARFQTLVPDTLKIQVYVHNQLQNYSFTTSGINFKTPEYEYTTNKGSVYQEEIVEVLDENDTTSAFISRVFPINISVAAGEVMAISVNYIPGHPYSAGDTLFSSSTNVANPMNRLDVLIDADPTKTHQNGFFNTGLFIDKTNGNNIGGYAGIYIPGLAYVDDYINSAFGFHIEAIDVGVESINEFGFSVEQNHPNPFSNQTTVDYKLTSTSNVNLQVFDITGKSVMTINEGIKNAGEHKVIIDGTNLKAGVYYYTFRTDAGQVTKKMLIQR